MKQDAQHLKDFMKNLHVLINTKEQLKNILSLSDKVSRIYIDSSIVNECDELIRTKRDTEIDLYIAAPYVLRQKDYEYFEKLLSKDYWSGILVRNTETLSFILNCEKLTCDNKCFDIVLDSNIYVLNSDTYRMIKNIYPEAKEYYASFELNIHEIDELITAIDEMYNDAIHSFVVYGKIPMMISANCVRKTNNECSKIRGFAHITDRMNKEFSVYCNCDYCYNVIYNSVPVSLHKYIDVLSKKGNLRIDLTDESGEYAKKIVDYFNEIIGIYKEPFFKEFTTAHIKRGIE